MNGLSTQTGRMQKDIASCSTSIQIDSFRPLLTIGSEIYRDTRINDQNILMAHHGTCHQSATTNGYSFRHLTHRREETVYCPRGFDMWKGKNLAAIQSSTFQSLKGKHLKYVKEYAAASTVFHETTHSKQVLGNDYTEGENWILKIQSTCRYILIFFLALICRCESSI